MTTAIALLRWHLAAMLGNGKVRFLLAPPGYAQPSQAPEGEQKLGSDLRVIYYRLRYKWKCHGNRNPEDHAVERETLCDTGSPVA